MIWGGMECYGPGRNALQVVGVVGSSRFEQVVVLVQYWRRVEEEDVAHPVAARLWEKRLTFGCGPLVPPDRDVGGGLVLPVLAGAYIFVNVIRARVKHRFGMEEKGISGGLLPQGPTEDEAE